MKYLPISKVPVMEEEDATSEVAEIFDEIRATQGIPSVGVMNLASATSPATLISVAYHDTLADAMKFDDPQRQQVMEGNM